MHILMVIKYPPIQGGVTSESYWTAQWLSALGHKVTVLTNSEEVETAYRVNIPNEEFHLLNGYWNRDTIRVVSSYQDEQHVFIPQVNPSVSKLIGLGLQIINEDRPDFIWSYYFEPYGIVAMQLSMLSNIPYSVRNAGSDLGRLLNTAQLRPLYEEMLRRAAIVFSNKRHNELLSHIGVELNNILMPALLSLPGDLFYPTEETSLQTDTFTYCIFGKTGRAKGTSELLSAAKVLKNRGSSIRINAYWAGVNMPKFLQMIQDLGLEEIVRIKPLVPHWKIPDVIRESNAVLYLENRFSVKFHSPKIPSETNACGRYLLTTQEIGSKNSVSNFLTEDNARCLSITTLQNPNSLANELEKVAEKLLSDGHPNPRSCLDASAISFQGRTQLLENLETISSLM